MMRNQNCMKTVVFHTSAKNAFIKCPQNLQCDDEENKRPMLGQNLAQNGRTHEHTLARQLAHSWNGRNDWA